MTALQLTVNLINHKKILFQVPVYKDFEFQLKTKLLI